MKNADMPSMPNSNPETYPVPCSAEWAYGLTKRERACIDLRIPETDDPELNALIDKARRQEIAARVTQSLVNVVDQKSWHCLYDAEDLESISKKALLITESVIFEMDRSDG